MTHNSAVDAESASARHRIRPLGWVALGFSLLTTAGLWMAVAGVVSGGLFGEAGWPDWLIETSGFFIGAGLPLIVVAIVLNVIAGIRGGRTRLVAVIAGLVLLSPMFSYAGEVVVGTIADLIHPGSG